MDDTDLFFGSFTLSMFWLMILIQDGAVRMILTYVFFVATLLYVWMKMLLVFDEALAQSRQRTSNE